MHAHRPNPLRRPARRGYALVLVLVFNVLFLALLGVAWRGVATAMRLETIRAIERDRDQGSTEALARAVHLLETGLPPASPYVCGATIATGGGAKAYTVTFTLEQGTTWTVRSAARQPGEDPPAMPNTFATIPPAP